eukprot:5780416-Prymnesium_polylepis.1
MPSVKRRTARFALAAPPIAVLSTSMPLSRPPDRFVCPPVLSAATVSSAFFFPAASIAETGSRVSTW